MKPNGFGLFDMLGNVYEWCQERASVYRRPARGRASEDSEDVLEIRDEESRPGRGGEFLDQPSRVCSTLRMRDRPSHVYDDFGFRVARTYRSRGRG